MFKRLGFDPSGLPFERCFYRLHTMIFLFLHFWHHCTSCWFPAFFFFPFNLDPAFWGPRLGRQDVNISESTWFNKHCWYVKKVHPWGNARYHVPHWGKLWWKDLTRRRCDPNMYRWHGTELGSPPGWSCLQHYRLVLFSFLNYGGHVVKGSMQSFDSIKSCISLAVRNILVFPHYTHAEQIF